MRTLALLCLLPAVAAAQSAGDVIELHQAGLDAETIISWLETSDAGPTQASKQDLLALRKANVDGAVIRAWLAVGRTPATAPTPAPAGAVSDPVVARLQADLSTPTPSINAALAPSGHVDTYVLPTFYGTSYGYPLWGYGYRGYYGHRGYHGYHRYYGYRGLGFGFSYRGSRGALRYGRYGLGGYYRFGNGILRFRVR